MGWLKTLFTGGISKVVDAVGDAIDKNVTNKEEVMLLHNALAKIHADAEAHAKELQLKAEQELSKRHAADMQSDDMWSKRVRPITMLYLVAVITVLALTDGNIQLSDYVFQIKPEYVELFKALLIAVFGFYFGSRGIEKVAKIVMAGRK